MACGGGGAAAGSPNDGPAAVGVPPRTGRIAAEQAIATTIATRAARRVFILFALLADRGPLYTEPVPCQGGTRLAAPGYRSNPKIKAERVAEQTGARPLVCSLLPVPGSRRFGP